jgi:hypothetical protein
MGKREGGEGDGMRQRWRATPGRLEGERRRALQSAARCSSEVCIASRTKWLGSWWQADPAWRGERDQLADGWGVWKRISRIFIDINFDSWLEKISGIIGKIKRKFIEIE